MRIRTSIIIEYYTIATYYRHSQIIGKLQLNECTRSSYYMYTCTLHYILMFDPGIYTHIIFMYSCLNCVNRIAYIYITTRAASWYFLISRLICLRCLHKIGWGKRCGRDHCLNLVFLRASYGYVFSIQYIFKNSLKYRAF